MYRMFCLARRRKNKTTKSASKVINNRVKHNYHRKGGKNNDKDTTTETQRQRHHDREPTTQKKRQRHNDRDTTTKTPRQRQNDRDPYLLPARSKTMFWLNQTAYPNSCSFLVLDVWCMCKQSSNCMVPPPPRFGDTHILFRKSIILKTRLNKWIPYW